MINQPYVYSLKGDVTCTNYVGKDDDTLFLLMFFLSENIISKTYMRIYNVFKYLQLK